MSAAPSLPASAVWSRRAVLIAATAFCPGELGEGVQRRAGIRVGIEAAAARAADAAPVAQQEGAAEQVGPDLEAVEALGIEAGRAGGLRRLGMISWKVYHRPWSGTRGKADQGCLGRVYVTLFLIVYPSRARCRRLRASSRTSGRVRRLSI